MNNAAPSSKTGATAPSDSASAVTVCDHNSILDLSVDEVFFYKRILTASERTALYNSGNGTAYTPSTAFNVVGNTTLSNLRLPAPYVPTSATAFGTVGQISWDADYIYICVGANTWKRSPLSTWP